MATCFSQKGTCMSTQPLLHESTSDATKIVRASLLVEDFLGLVNPLLNPGKQSKFFELPQDTPIAQ